MARRSAYSITYPNTTQYTKGFEYSLDGENYIGEYHVVDGQAFTGPPLTDKLNRRSLTKYYNNQNNYNYDKLVNFGRIQATFISPRYIKPSPNTGDYRLGYFTRYLLQDIRNKQSIPIEVGQTGLDRYGKQGGYDSGLYDLITLKWLLVGPLYDQVTTIKNQTQIISGETVVLQSYDRVVAGIIDENKRTTMKLVERYPALPYAFKNYQEFAQPTII